MKAAALVAVALVLCVALPDTIQAKEKSTFCIGKDGKNYAVGDSYVDNEGEACIRYKCAKRKRKFIMKKEKCDCNGGNHGISCCPNYVRGDMVGGSEIKITFSPNTENGCQNSCKVQHPTSIGVTQDHDGTSSCYCEFGSPIVGGSANVYKTCLFSTATSGVLKTIKRRIAATTTTTTAPTTTSTSSTSNMTTLTTTRADSIYFIAGGGGAMRDIELYHPTMANLSCSMSPPPLNNDWHHHTTFYYNNTIHLYGGSSTGSTCISYSNNTEEWKTHTLTTSRRFGSSSVVLNNRVFIIGGIDASYNYVGAESTPLPLTDQPVLTPEPNLDYKGTGQCTTKVDEDTLVVTGGYYNSYFSSVIEYNAKTRTTTSLPSMKQPRNYHGCAVVEMDNNKWIIVAGGRSDVLETTEMLQMGGSYWKPLGNLNVARYGHSIAVTQSGVMAMGGRDTRHYFLSSVELLDWSTMSWRIVQPSLSKSRYHFGGAVEIPASMIRCQAADDGEWSAWSKFTACSATCGNTTKTRKRTCSNPSPSNGGKPCPGLDEEVVSCGLSTCDSIYFIAGGYGTGGFPDIELYHPTMANLSCSMSPPPLNDWYRHTTFYYKNTIHLYGGYYRKASTCISYKTNTEEWKNHTLSTPRKWGHTSTILNKRVYFIGGRDTSGNNYVGAESTPLPLTDRPVLTPVQNLDFKGVHQCTTKVDEDTLVITGGHTINSYSSSVIEYNAKTRTTTSLPSMKQQRRSRHGCAVVEMDNTKWIIVTGGWTSAESYLKTTEMLQMGESSWKPLGNLNVARRGHSIAVTQRGIMSMGGFAGRSGLSSVELLDWSTMSWRIVQPSLSKSRYNFGGAVEIPASMFDCRAADDGEWSAWSKFTACSATCGNTTKTRNRTCSNPSPSNGGKPCPGLDEEVVSCGLSPCGFNMSATCDDVMWLFADGDLLVNNSSDWRVTSEVHIPACTKVIEIHCLDSWIHGGILASSDNGLITNGAWNCSSDNRTTWNPAYLLGRNGRTAPDISPEAIWIWTDMSHWMQTDHRRHTKAICKIELETSQCPEPPVCPPFGELTPTTISTPTPAPTTTTTSTTSKPKPGFNLTATCDNEMKLFVDGNLLATSSNWRDTSKVNIPANTEAIEIHCMDTGTVGGILASSDNGLLTDGAWNCSSDNGATWNPAYEVGPNGGAVPDISPEAEWIWTGCIGDWTSKYTGKKYQKNIICKIDLKPVIDGGWSTWRPFSPCSATCADATKARTRTCSQPSPNNGGNPCLGLEEEIVTCGLSPCGEDSEDSCPYTDKYMDCPQWKNHCESGQWGKCMKENCPKTCNCTDTINVTTTTRTSTIGGPQFGDWSPWSSWSPCSSTCGIAVKARTRTCLELPCPPGITEETASCHLLSCGPYMQQKCFLEDSNITFLDLGHNHMKQDLKPVWKIGDKGRSLTEELNTRPSIGLSNLGDITEPVSFSGRVFSASRDDDVIGMVFGFWNESNFFVIASARQHPGPTNWYVARLHATCGSSCAATTTISNAIWDPQSHPEDITVLATGSTYWQHGNEYNFTVSFNPSDLLVSVNVTNQNQLEPILETGIISAKTNDSEVDAVSGKGGFVGVYVDSQAQTTWDYLVCQDSHFIDQTTVKGGEWKLGMNINPCDGANFGYGGPWAPANDVGSLNESLTKDFVDSSVWKTPASFVTIARHVDGQCTMSKTWELTDKTKSMYDYFSTYPGRIYATGDGSVNDNHISSDIPEAAEGLEGTWRDPIFGADGGLVFNWYYSNNGARIAVPGGYKIPYTLPSVNNNGEDLHGLGNENAGDTINGNGGGEWCDVAMIGPDCHGRSALTCKVVGTDRLDYSKHDGPCWGSYAIFVSQNAQAFSCQGRDLSQIMNADTTSITTTVLVIGPVPWITMSLEDFSVIPSNTSIPDPGLDFYLHHNGAYSVCKVINGIMYLCNTYIGSKWCISYNGSGLQWKLEKEMKLEVPRSHPADTLSPGDQPRWIVQGGMDNFYLGRKYRGIVEVWTPESGKWRIDSNYTSPQPNDIGCILVIEGKILQVGGRIVNPLTGGALYTNRVFLGDMEVASMKEPRIYIDCTIFENRVWVAGGATSHHGALAHTVEIYDYKNDTWTSGPSFPPNDDGSKYFYGKLKLIKGDLYFICVECRKIFKLINTEDVYAWEAVADIPKNSGHIAEIMEIDH